MHKWQISNRVKWLCTPCTKNFTDVILFGGWQWQDEVIGKNITCDNCGCPDHIVRQFGCLRWLYSLIVNLFRKRQDKAMRRAL